MGKCKVGDIVGVKPGTRDREMPQFVIKEGFLGEVVEVLGEFVWVRLSVPFDVAYTQEHMDYAVAAGFELEWQLLHTNRIVIK